MATAFTPLPANLRRLLRELRERGAPVALSALARELLAAEGPVAPPLARRIVATALGRAASELPDPLEVHDLRPASEVGAHAVGLEAARFHVVDLETTGVSAERSSILEIGAVRIAALACGEEFSTLVRPREPVPARIAELTGIGSFELQGAPPAAEALPAFRTWLDRAPEAPFVAHNASFDARFTARGLEGEGLPPLEVPVLCTRQLARRLLPGLGRYDLDHLCAHFRIPNAARHRALGDAQATARALVELLRIALESGAARTLGELLDLQERPPARRRRASRTRSQR